MRSTVNAVGMRIAEVIGQVACDMASQKTNCASYLFKGILTRDQADPNVINLSSPDNVRVIPDAGDVDPVGADTIAKLSAQTSEPRANAAWDQRIVICGAVNLLAG